MRKPLRGGGSLVCSNNQHRCEHFLSYARETSMRTRDLQGQSARVNAPSTPSTSPPASLPRYYAHYMSHRGMHDAHTGCPCALSCLIDLDTEPTTDSTETLVRCAILGNATRQASVQGILDALKGKYPFYRTAESERNLKVHILLGWTSSHQLI